MILVLDEQIIHDFILKINFKIFILHFIILGLLEELKNGNFNTYLLLIVVILIFHIYWTKDNKEPMSAVSNDLKEAIKKVYLADVEAIRNLSEVATKLQSGGLSVPGNLTTSGNTTVNGSKLITSNNNTIECGGRQHMSGPELLYILHKNGVVIGKEWGGNGNLNVQGNLTFNGEQVNVIYPAPWDHHWWTQRMASYFNRGEPDGIKREFLIIHPGGNDPNHSHRWTAYFVGIKQGRQVYFFEPHHRHQDIPNPANHDSNDHNWRRTIP
jgi:hypothetical protein